MYLLIKINIFMTGMHVSRWPDKSALNGLLIIALLCCVAANAAAEPWQNLTAAQKEALAPLAGQWATLSETQQERLVKTANRYPHLTPEHRKRFRDRLTYWSQLTPEQRDAAREKYLAFKKVPADKREEVKKMVQEERERKQQSEDWFLDSDD